MRYPLLRHSTPSGGANKSQGGFTLTEMLVTMLIMVMASILLATGVPAAMDTYSKTVNAANAQVALSTTVSAMRGELSLASDVRYSADKSKVYYLSNSEGCWISLGQSQSSDGKGLEKTYYKGVLAPGEDVSSLQIDSTIDPVPLIADASITDSLRVRVGGDKGKNGFAEDSSGQDVVAVNNLRVEDGSGNELAKIDGTYRVLARFED